MCRGSLAACSILLAGLLSSCASAPPRPQELVSTARLVNSVKCSFALALVAEQGLAPEYQRLKGNVASFELQLKVVDKRTIGGGIGTGIVPWQGGLNFSRAQAWTVDTILNASYTLNADNARVCEAAGVKRDQKGELEDPFGFTRWLRDTIVDLSRVSLEKPTGQLDKLTYEALFGVTQAGGVEGSIKLAFLSGNLSANMSRDDLQRIKIVISGAPGVAKEPAKPGSPPTGGGLGPMFVPPSLSSAVPAVE